MMSALCSSIRNRSWSRSIWRIRSGLPVRHDVRGLELLATLGACVIDRLHHDRASCTAAANKYLWDTLAAYLSVCVCVHLFSAAAVWLIESNARAHRMWVRHEFAFAFVSIAIAMNVSVSVAICICLATTTMTASILGICRLQINHFVGHKNRRQHCELIIEAKSRLESRQLVATWGTQLKGVSSALVPGRKSIDMISGPAHAPLPPSTLPGWMWGVVPMLATQIRKTIASIKRGTLWLPVATWSSSAPLT